MAILGIVAEFNPFHNGHLHLLQVSRKHLKPDAVICVMSGNYTQRGEPALCDKWSRTRMALAGGADLVLELPFCFAVRSANHFARGALQILNATGLVTHLVFGSETGTLTHLQTIADVLADEPPAYRDHLQQRLDQGCSFAAARAQALEEMLGRDLTDISKTLKSPNNILALEYLRIIRENGFLMEPFTIRRHGSGYHDLALSTHASASAIRRAVAAGGLDHVAGSLPVTTMAILRDLITTGQAPVSSNGLELAMLFRFRTAMESELRDVYEVNEGLENRIISEARRTGSLEQLRHAVKSKRYSLTRINRTLLYSLFDVSKNQMTVFDQVGPQYLRLLGFSSKGREILQNAKNNSPLPLLSRANHLKEIMQGIKGEPARAMLSLDLTASDIYALLAPNPAIRNAGQDFTRSVERF